MDLLRGRPSMRGDAERCVQDHPLQEAVRIHLTEEGVRRRQAERLHALEHRERGIGRRLKRDTVPHEADEEHAQRPHVRLRPVVRASEHLRSGVRVASGGALDDSVVRGESKVDEDRRPVLAQHQVVGFDVTVNDPLGVEEGDGARRVAEGPIGAVRRPRVGRHRLRQGCVAQLLEHAPHVRPVLVPQVADHIGMVLHPREVEDLIHDGLPLPELARHPSAPELAPNDRPKSAATDHLHFGHRRVGRPKTFCVTLV